MNETSVIRMQRDEIKCSLCGAWAPFRWGVPTFNGDVVSNNFPDNLGTGNLPVCQCCYDRHEAGLVPTYDHYYVRPGPLGVCLINGAGI